MRVPFFAPFVWSSILFRMFSIKLLKIQFILFVTAKPSFEHQDCPVEEVSSPTALLVHDLLTGGHYDKLSPPPTTSDRPLPVYIKIYFYFLQSNEAHDLQFSIYMLLQCRFVDSRLRFDPNVYNTTEITGTKEMSRLFWTPHIVFNNERASSVMGPGEDEIVTYINHEGTVLYTKRIQTTLFCWMKLHKFPFDSQHCNLVMDNWSHNVSEVELLWEDEQPIWWDHLSLTEFTLIGDPQPTRASADLNFNKVASDVCQNCTALVVAFHLQRKYGYYIYDYFIPSILLVIVSWVSFWLEPEELVVSGRVILGCSTMLTFIIKAHQTGNSLLKVSYIKASEIWFLGCTAFIFASLVEFAFVNTIYRSRRKVIGLKKVNSKYILRETMTTRFKKKKRKIVKRLASSARTDDVENRTKENHLKHVNEIRSRKGFRLTIKGAPCNRELRKNRRKPPVTLSSREVSNWIDKRSRIGFPITFVIFNICYWIYVCYF